MEDTGSPLAPRVKRLKVDKKGRLAALEKLKQLKGGKHKYEVSDIDNVYDEVDEREYTKKVIERQDEDWIVDDDGSGYVEDGREIFDDDLDDDSIISATSQSKKVRAGSKRGRDGRKETIHMSASSSGKSSNIRSMLMNMPAKKKKETTVKLDEDAILEDIMEELNNSNVGLGIVRPTAPHCAKMKRLAPVQPPDLTVRNYIQSLTSHTPKVALNSFTPKAEVGSLTGAVKEQKVESGNMLPENDDIQVELPGDGLEAGILPTEIRKLVESRREVKKLMKNTDLSPDVKMQYNIRQMALKLTANSMYGCLGFPHSRFYAKPLAALVTAKGREILLNTKEHVEKMNFQVIYGDTDSIMINTNCSDYDQVFKIGHKIKVEVNKLYRQVELDIDGVFKYMLLLKKKKYAAVTISRLPSGELITQQELKGLDIVRRDWSQVSAEAGKYILEQILSDQEPDERLLRIHEHLERLRVDLETGTVPLPLLTITKQLTKNPEEYTDKKSLPHVQVALRLNEHIGRKLKQGDTVPYIICEDRSSLAPTQRAYHVDELKTNEKLKVDVKYYLSQQIHPVVSRLCEPIEGTGAACITESLGLDPSNYCHARGPVDAETNVGDKFILLEEQRFSGCEKFKFFCRNEACKAEIVMDNPVKKVDDKFSHFSLEKCSNPQCTVSPVQYLASIQNSLTMAIRKYIHRYYENWLICEDPGCTNRIRRILTDMRGGFPHCNLCKSAVMYKEYNECELYTQLSFFQYIFDLSKVTDKRPSNLEVEKTYDRLREQAEQTLRHSAYGVVDLGNLFQPLLSFTMSVDCRKS